MRYAFNLSSNKKRFKNLVMNIFFYMPKAKIVITYIILLAALSTVSFLIFKNIQSSQTVEQSKSINDNVIPTSQNKEKKATLAPVVDNPDADYINLKDFGAKGEGVSSVKEDTKALEDAIASLRKQNGGKLYIPASDKFYAYAGNGIVLSDNIEIYGDGVKSHIRNVNPDMNKWYKGVIFFTSTYGPTNKISIMQQPKYVIGDAKKGSSTIELKDAGNSKQLKEGEVIVLGANPFSKDEDANKTRFLYIEQNEIISITGTSIQLKYPTSVDLLTTGSDKPVIVDVNGAVTTSLLGVKNQTTKQVKIHDLRLSQAQTNEIDNVPLKNTPTSVMQLGGTFESKFYNLQIDGYSGISGNMWARCEFSNIEINANRNLVDWGYGSHNSKLKNVKYTFLKSPNTDIPKAFIYFSESSHDIEMEDIQASGNWNGSNILLIGNGAKGLIMKNADIDFSNLNNPNFGINIADQNNKVYSSDVLLENVKIKVNKIKKFIRCSGANTMVNRNIQLNNVEFSDATNSLSEDDFVVSNMKGVHFKDVYSQKRKLNISDVTTLKIKQDLNKQK